MAKTGLEFKDDEVILIQHTIARIEPNANGDHSMLATAFLEIGKYFDTVSIETFGPEIEFVFRGVTYSAAAYNKEKANTMREEATTAY